MNANELANIADGLSIEIPIREWIDNEPKNVMTDIANMLRQQQTKLEKSQELLREYTALNMRQQAEIEALKERVIGDEYVFICKRCGDELGIKLEEKEEPTVDEVMAEHCTCYKLGYSQLNDYRKVNNENNNEAA